MEWQWLLAFHLPDDVLGCHFCYLPKAAILCGLQGTVYRKINTERLETYTLKFNGTTMTGSDLHTTYRAYLLRCWAELPAGGSQWIWRFNLDSAREGKPRSLASLEALMEYIRSEIGDAYAGDESSGSFPPDFRL